MMRLEQVLLIKLKEPLGRCVQLNRLRKDLQRKVDQTIIGQLEVPRHRHGIRDRRHRLQMLGLLKKVDQREQCQHDHQPRRGQALNLNVLRTADLPSKRLVRATLDLQPDLRRRTHDLQPRLSQGSRVDLLIIIVDLRTQRQEAQVEAEVLEEVLDQLLQDQVEGKCVCYVFD